MINLSKYFFNTSPPYLFVFCAFLQITACTTVVKVGTDIDQEPADSGPEPGSINVSKVPNAVPKDEPKSRYGNPPSYVVNGIRYYVLNSSDNFVERGIASWYGEKFHGRRTSSGETYDMYGMTAAHKSLPLPTYVEVININNGKSVILKVNDRGPFHENRIIDLSYAAAAKLDILKNGTGLVEVRSINPNGRPRSRTEAENQTVSVSSAPSYNNSGFYIQVGAYSEMANAVNMREKLGPLADRLLMISKTIVNGKVIYRVRFGPISNVELADSIVNNLKNYGVYEHYITLD